MKRAICNPPPLPMMIVSALLLSTCTAPAVTPAPGTSDTLPPVSTALPSPTTIPSSTTPSGRVRRSVVAGSWYPDDPSELATMMDEMLASVQPVDGAPIGLIVPHAGYLYSGPVAATGFRQLEGGDYDVAVIIASDHQLPLSAPISVWTEGGFETPLGMVPVNVGLASAVAKASPRISFDPASHEGEHPIEIELPFLQRVCPHCSIVPVLMGAADDETVRTLVEALLAVLPDHRVVVVASSDLSHYPVYDDALRVDGATLAAIETGNPARVRETIRTLMAAGVTNLATCACGEGPILVAMQVARGLGADTTTVLRYANSGDSPDGDQGRVVGYGAVMFWRREPPDLTEAEREELLALARTTIEEYLATDRIPDYETDAPALSRLSGTFVTLKQHGELRGCVGHTRADVPLYQAVQQMAVAAATGDRRFPPLTPEELADVTVEISVLSPFQRLTDVGEIQVGTHGLTVFKDGRQGILLPQVPVEQGWDRETFLENLCLKAGLPGACWLEGASLYAFTALVFGEE